MASPEIETYQFGEVVIDGRSYRRDVIILPDRVLPDWWREQGHSLAVQDLEEVLRDPPTILIVGQGAYGQMKIPDATRLELEQAGLKVIAGPTAEAVKTYNQMRKHEKVVAALHLTC